MRRKFMSMALTAAMVLSMAATPVFAEDTASDEGFNLNLCIASEPQTIDPALNSAVDGAIMCNHMFEGLAKWVNDGEGNAVTAPGQAESWEKAENEDGTVTYTVKLRDGIKWSDGQAVTAGDFVYAWQRLANPETAADYCYMIDMVKGYDALLTEVRIQALLELQQLMIRLFRSILPMTARISKKSWHSRQPSRFVRIW